MQSQRTGKHWHHQGILFREIPVTDVVTAVMIAAVFSAAATMRNLSGFGFSPIPVDIPSLLIGPKFAVPLVVSAGATNCICIV